MSRVIVCDDFYSDPDRVRSLAMRSQYQNVVQLNYPGFQSLKAFRSIALEKKISALIDSEITTGSEKLTFGKFRIMLKETASSLSVHVDGLAEWTGVLYLNLPEQCCGGTAFYRHRSTGLEGPPNADQLGRLGYGRIDEFQERIIRVDTSRAEAWEISQFVAMKYNRLVLFKGNQLFHCHTESFGIDKTDGRLTQNFFFNEA